MPLAGVALAQDGTLYETTSSYGQYGYGTVYRLQPPATVCHAVMCPWTETILYNFTGGADGGYPGYGTLTFDQAGNIYERSPSWRAYVTGDKSAITLKFPYSNISLCSTNARSSSSLCKIWLPGSRALANALHGICKSLCCSWLQA